MAVKRRPPPSDPAEIARNRAKAQHVGGVQRLGFVLAGLGVLTAVLRGTVLPTLSAILPLVLVVMALALMPIGMVLRWRYRLQCMRDLDFRMSLANSLVRSFSAMRLTSRRGAGAAPVSKGRGGRDMHEIRSIQYLRGVAAVMVAIHHSMVHAAPFHFVIGAAGVDLFFVISGFIMWITTKDRAVSPVTFMEKRIVRVVPLYWLATVVTVAAHAYRPEIVFMWDSYPMSVVRSLFFYPRAQGALFLTTVNQGWTLCYEMFFYVIFAFCLLVGNRMLRLWSLGAVFAVVLLSGNWVASPFTSSIILEFLFGVLIAVVTDKVTIARGYAFLCLAVGVLALIALNLLGLDRVLMWGIPAALIVLGTVWIENAQAIPRIPVLQILGDASYSIYIWHILAFGLLMLLPIVVHDASPVIIVAKIVLALGIGVVLHRLVEIPLTAAVRRGVGLRIPLLDRLRRAGR